MASSSDDEEYSSFAEEVMHPTVFFQEFKTKVPRRISIATFQATLSSTSPSSW